MSKHPKEHNKPSSRVTQTYSFALSNTKIITPSPKDQNVSPLRQIHSKIITSPKQTDQNVSPVRQIHSKIITPLKKQTKMCLP